MLDIAYVGERDDIPEFLGQLKRWLRIALAEVPL